MTKTKGRSFTVVKKSMRTDKEFKDFCKSIAEEYGNSKGEFARSYFTKQYDISISCYYKILETAIIRNWVSDEIVEKMEEKALENQKVNSSVAGLSTRKHYAEMRRKRQEYIISLYLEREIEELATKFAYSSLSKKEFAKKEGISIKTLDQLLEKSIVEAIVDDIVFYEIRQRSFANEKKDKKRVEDFFIQLAKRRNSKIDELLSK